MKRKNKKIVHATSILFATVTTCVVIGYCGKGLSMRNVFASNAGNYEEKIEFESAKRFSTDSGNRVDKKLFKDYSGDGYVYMVSGWAEVGFTVPEDGEYEFTIVSTSDQYKENWLYLDQDPAGTLKTNSGSWGTSTYKFKLSKGTHKFGVSSNWGYVALDYVKIKSLNDNISVTTEPTKTTQPDQTTQPVQTTSPINKDDPAEGKGMYINGANLYDAKGNPFVMRGVNIAHAWYTDKTSTSINAVADLGSNCVRVVLADGSQWTKTTKSEVEAIISECRKNKMICILEVHDHTGKDSTSELDQAVNYWLEMKDILNANKGYVIVNIANEWLGTWNKGDVWESAYCNAVKKIRDAGIQNVLMVDAAGYGQETSSLIDHCTNVKNADKTGNIMFSIHMYSVAGKDGSTVKSNIDKMISKNVSFCIGEFGDYQNNADVDERTIIDYCADKKIGTIAWSWKGNGGSDVTLDLSKDWEGKELNDWGKVAFYSDNAIQKTSKLAYFLTDYNGEDHSDEGVDNVDHSNDKVDDDTDVVDPDISEKIGIDAGVISELKTKWYVSGEGDDTVSTVSKMETLENKGIRVNFDLEKEAYPYLINKVGGVDLSKHKTINVVVRNNSRKTLQLQPIFKVGTANKWTEYDKYQEIPANTTTMLTFDMSSCSREQVEVFLFRIQGAGSKVAGTVDFLSIGYDLAENEYKDQITELNRPKSASYFTWAYPENSWTEHTVSSKCDENGKLNVEFKNVTSDAAAGIQTETKPGLGKGMDCSAYKSITCTITNKSAQDIHTSLLFRTGGGWTWQENGGIVTGEKDGERIIPAGKSVKVTYKLTGSTWKSKASNWNYTGALEGIDDVRALGFKIYTGEGSTASGNVEITDFAFH